MAPQPAKGPAVHTRAWTAIHRAPAAPPAACALAALGQRSPSIDRPNQTLRSNAQVYDRPSRAYDGNVGDEYDAWTDEGILEYYWGEHIHLGWCAVYETNTHVHSTGSGPARGTHDRQLRAQAGPWDARPRGLLRPAPHARARA